MVAEQQFFFGTPCIVLVCIFFLTRIKMYISVIFSNMLLKAYNAKCNLQCILHTEIFYFFLKLQFKTVLCRVAYNFNIYFCILCKNMANGLRYNSAENVFFFAYFLRDVNLWYASSLYNIPICHFASWNNINGVVYVHTWIIDFLSVWCFGNVMCIFRLKSKKKWMSFKCI